MNCIFRLKVPTYMTSELDGIRLQAGEEFFLLTRDSLWGQHPPPTHTKKRKHRENIFCPILPYI